MISRTRRGGMSMVEVMIAISVLAFVLLAFLSVVQSSATLSASSREGSVASFQLHAALEATFALPFDDFVRVYDPAAVADASDPDHPPGALLRGHLGSRPNVNPGQASELPDYCQRVKDSSSPADQRSSNFTWTPGAGWAKADDLPLTNQHIFIEWVSSDKVGTVDWVEYRLTISWTNYRGKTQTDSVTTRRSR